MSKILNYIKSIGIIHSLLLIAFLSTPMNIGFVFGYALFISIFLKKSFIKKNLDKHFFMLLAFSVVYALFYLMDPIGGVQYFFIYLTFPVTLYLWGKYIAYRLELSDFTMAFIVIGLVFSSIGMISILLNIMSDGLGQSSRDIPYFWAETSRNATNMAVLFVFNMCIPAYLMTNDKRLSLLQKGILGLLFFISLLCVIRLGSRSQLAILMFTFVIGLVYLFPRQRIKQNVGLLLALLALSGVIYKNVSFDLNANWLAAFESRLKSSKNTVANAGNRSERWEVSLQNLVDKPLGWGLEDIGHAHNLWLDTARVGSLISAFLLLIYTVWALLNLKKAVFLRKKSLSINVVMICFFLALYLSFMVEPIIDSSFTFFTAFCLFNGVILIYRKKISESKKEQELVHTDTENISEIVP